MTDMGFTWSETITTGTTEIKTIHWSELHTNIDFLKDNPSGCGTDNTSVDATADATVDTGDNASVNSGANSGVDSGDNSGADSGNNTLVVSSEAITGNGSENLTIHTVN
ncbi:MAG: hypothetical protein PHH61_06260 [Candidatus Nanoarchaeia archaeon]|nr:hypothetical protein [Candidatus Nanoarchaeia archaeon]